jgi:osmotically-inducible protein OsmY
MRSDSDIRRDVEDELRWDPEIDPTDIAVSVKNGVIALTGFVRSYPERHLAEAAAKRVAGVVGVANDLEVRLPDMDQRPDPEIARDAIAQIKNELPYAWEKIRVVVKNARIALEGEVEWNYQRERAEAAVRRVRGVEGVINSIEATHVTVETNGGEVILGGTVRSWAQRQEAERAAWAAPGVAKVDNRIVVSR